MTHLYVVPSTCSTVAAAFSDSELPDPLSSAIGPKPSDGDRRSIAVVACQMQDCTRFRVGIVDDDEC